MRNELSQLTGKKQNIEIKNLVRGGGFLHVGKRHFHSLKHDPVKARFVRLSRFNVINSFVKGVFDNGELAKDLVANFGIGDQL
jgi:hypothetical protein